MSEKQSQTISFRLATVNNEIRRQQMCKELLIKTSKVLTGSNSNKRGKYLAQMLLNDCALDQSVEHENLIISTNCVIIITVVT